MIGPLSRILARVAAGALIGAGLVSEGQIAGFDADLAEAIGAALWAATEAFYALAKRMGWKT